MVLAILGALGGAAVFATAVAAVIRAVFKNVKAVEDNTEATRELSEGLGELRGIVNGHGERIARLEGFRRHSI